MKRSLGLLAAGVALVATGCGMFGNVNADLTHDGRAEEEYLAGGPDAFVDRMGEPDEWKNRTENDQLFMTAIWRCVDGEYHEVTWRSRVQETGAQYWDVVEDVTRECDGGK